MTARAFAPMALALGLALAIAPPLPAQRAVLGAGYALAGYAEQGTELRFAGGGASGMLDLAWRRLALRLTGSRLALSHVDGDAAGEPFDMTQMDVRLGVRVAPTVSLEAGFLGRSVSPANAAQEVGAFRIGARAAYPLASATDLTVRLGYLGGTHFSGGGSAPLGVELGLGVSYGFGAGRIRATGDYELQRLDRRTTVAGERIDVPIQSSVARFGVAIGI
jgi:hypothetical protein